MLVIRMQRTGRKGHAMFRVVVQDSRRTPTSGKIVAQLGNYDPHSKTFNINAEKASFYMEHGAQPSERVARLLKAEGVKLPSWVVLSDAKARTVRNAEKRRSTAPEKPAEEVAEAPEEAPAEPEAPAEDAVAEAPAEAVEENVEEVAEAPVAEEAVEAVAETEPAAEPAAEATETPETPAEAADPKEA